jgi:general secretion pathway protein D
MKNKKFTTILIVALASILDVIPIVLYSEDAITTETAGLQVEESNSVDSEGLRFNFRGAPLDTVLDYMSRAAGFVIIRETDVSGRVDIVSHQPISGDEAVDLLNTVLNKEGYAAIRNGRILTIVKRDEAAKRNIPVKSGRNPQEIPPTDEMVTQIVPVRYANAAKLLDNIKPLLPGYAIVSANESSNAIILTDTQSHIRRMTEIIQALDTSISDISTLRVFMLKYADATDVAKIISELFKVSTTTQERSRDFRPPFFERRENRGDEDSSSRANSEALQASTRVVAVADENTNSVVVSAPEDIMPTIEKLISEVDATSQDITEVRVFPLKYADAQEMTDIIENIFKDQNTAARTRSSTGRGGFLGRFMQNQTNQQQQSSQRKKEENTVLIRPDTRTNSVVVSASSDVMAQVAEVIKQLDANPAREKKVHVYSLKNADAATVADTLKQLFTEQTRQSSGTRSNTTTQNTGTNTRNTGANTRNTNTSNQTQR